MPLRAELLCLLMSRKQPSREPLPAESSMQVSRVRVWQRRSAALSAERERDLLDSGASSGCVTAAGVASERDAQQSAAARLLPSLALSPTERSALLWQPPPRVALPRAAPISSAPTAATSAVHKAAAPAFKRELSSGSEPYSARISMSTSVTLEASGNASARVSRYAELIAARDELQESPVSSSGTSDAVRGVSARVSASATAPRAAGGERTSTHAYELAWIDASPASSRVSRGDPGRVSVSSASSASSQPATSSASATVALSLQPSSACTPVTVRNSCGVLETRYTMPCFACC